MTFHDNRATTFAILATNSRNGAPPTVCGTVARADRPSGTCRGTTVHAGSPGKIARVSWPRAEWTSRSVRATAARVDRHVRDGGCDIADARCDMNDCGTDNSARKCANVDAASPIRKRRWYISSRRLNIADRGCDIADRRCDIADRGCDIEDRRWDIDNCSSGGGDHQLRSMQRRLFPGGMCCVRNTLRFCSGRVLSPTGWRRARSCRPVRPPSGVSLPHPRASRVRPILYQNAS
jgi:hypothetical protein